MYIYRVFYYGQLYYILKKSPMNILTEIVDLLSDEENSLASALLKMKVLSSRLNNHELSEWINREINGYGDEDILPEYRKFPSIIRCDFVNENWKYTNFNIPMEAFPPEVRGTIDTVILKQDISSLESISDHNNLKFTIPSSSLYFINQYYQQQGNIYFSAYSVWCETSSISIKELLSKVRSYALDLILKLEQNFGYEIELQELIRKRNDVNKIINNIMSQTVITNIGDGNLINSGNENIIDNDIKVTKSNFENLKELLARNGVQEKDIQDLQEILVDEPELINNRFGTKINTWIKNMLSKSLDGTWQISIGAAGDLLAQAIMKYYGE